MTKRNNQPLGGNDMPRFANLGTMFRLPLEKNYAILDSCFVGIPLDIGTSYRSGTRFGPSQIRQESAMLRPHNMATGVSPFDKMQVADIGDIAIDTFNLRESVKIIENFYDQILNCDCTPLTLGGDHTITYPILKSMAKKYGKISLIHIDAHADVNDMMFGEKIAHGTTFRRALEDNCLDTNFVFQIGLRGTGYGPDDFNWCREQGFSVYNAEDLWYKSCTPLIHEIKEKIGTQKPVYISFDIDSLDPSFAPGTGTLEIGGLSVYQVLEIIRGCIGLNIIACDLVEVSPPYDRNGTTANLAANLLYEMLCVLPRTLT